MAEHRKKRNPVLSTINNHRIKSYSILSASIGLITDVLQPLAPFAREAFIGSTFVAVVLILLSLNSQVRLHLKNSLAFFVMLGVFSGGIWAAQESGYDEYGVFASFIPPLHEVQKDLGIIERLENIEHDIALVGADVKDVKAEVTKTLKVNDLIHELDKARTQTEKEKIIILIKKYPFEKLLDPAQATQIMSHFSGEEKADLGIKLSEYMRPTMTSKQFFELLEPDIELNNYVALYQSLSTKLKMKLQFEDFMLHMKQVGQISDSDHRKLFRAQILLRHLEEVTEKQKLQIAKTLNVDLFNIAHEF